MRGAIIHGVLLVVMLVYGYRTWTRDKTEAPNLGSVVLWDRNEADLVAIEYKAPKKIVKLERKADYWWGTDTTIETRPKPSKDQAAGSGAGSAGSAAGSNAVALPPPVEEEEVGRKSREFPLGEAGDKLVKSYAAARALRDLGPPNAEAKKDYKLDDVKTTISITFKDGKPHTFLVGGSVYGGSDKYALDQENGHAYVLSKDLVSALEIGESSLHLLDPRGFDVARLEQVTIEAGGKSKTGVRVQTGVEGQQVKTWGDPDTKKANQTLANFIDNTNNLRPTEYSADTKIAELTQVMKLTYKDERGATLGTLALYKHMKPGTLPEGQELDPANPPAGEVEYFIVTEKTRVPALVRKDTAERAENDIETVFSNKPQPEEGKSQVEPKGNPFGTPGAPNPHGAAPVNPHAMPPAPGAGSAAPAKAGAITPAAPKATDAKATDAKAAKPATEAKPPEAKAATPATETKSPAPAPAPKAAPAAAGSAAR